MYRILMVGVVVWGSVCGVGIADVRLPKIFTSNMVLQQEMPIRVWGWGDKGEEVEVSIGKQVKKTNVGKDGRWKVELGAMKADGKKHVLKVVGKNVIELKNILIGEVWLCAGQSNMNREVAVKESDAGIRLFWIDGSVVPREEELGEWVAGWVESTPEGVKGAKERLFRGKKVKRNGFAEVGYVFGRRLHKELGVPVGLIKCAFGGSNVSAWTPAEDVWKLYKADEKVEGRYLGHRRGLMYQSMVRGFVGMSMRGVIWYQGENDGRNRKYHEDMKKWIGSWRKLWGREDMPFYYVQIAPTSYAGGKMQYLWESQVRVMEELKGVGMAVTNDMMLPSGRYKGKVDEKTGFKVLGGSNPHPNNKQLAGERLAKIALAKSYGRKGLVIYGPMYESHRVKGGKIYVKFKYAGSGLAVRGGGEMLNWFEVSDGTKEGRNMKWVSAKAKIVGKDEVVVWVDGKAGVGVLKYVRFGWHCLARFNLMNKEGLPGVSFRVEE